jgi:hypothetical protein
MITEQMVSSVFIYHTGSVEGGHWITDGSGYLRNAHVPDEFRAACVEFYDLCSTAIDPLVRQNFFDARRYLSMACGLARRILSQAEPRTIERFVNSILVFYDRGMKEISIMLVNHLAEMATATLHPNNPLIRILVLLRYSVQTFCSDMLHMILRCILAAFTQALGTWHKTALRLRLSPYSMSEGSALRSSETPLRSLLLECRSYHQHASINELQILRSLAWYLQLRRRYQESEVVANNLLEVTYDTALSGPDRLWGRSEALDVLSESQFMQGRRNLAVESMRTAITASVEYFGCRDVATTYRQSRMENMLLEMEKNAEARGVRIQIDAVIGEDDLLGASAEASIVTMQLEEITDRASSWGQS